MDDDRLARLEDEIERLEDQLTELRGQLALAELDRWKGRIDDLEVQARLASMEADDRVAPLLEMLRNRWLDARSSLSQGAAVASEVSETLWKGLEQAFGDLRAALLDARAAATR